MLHLLNYCRVFEEANIWIGGSVVMKDPIFTIEGRMSAFVSLPSITSVS